MSNPVVKSPLGRSIILCTFFFAVEFMGSIGIGAISFRNIVLGIMILYLLFNHTNNSINIAPVKYLFIYYIYVAIIGLVNDLYGWQGNMLVFARMLPSAIVFFFTLKYVDSTKMLNYVLLILPLWVILDGVATILQGINHPTGWALASITRSSNSVGEELERINIAGNSIGTSSASGLIGTVVGNGFFLASYGLLFCIPFIYTRKLWGGIYSAIILVTCIIALFYNQQRLAFYSYIFTAICLFIYYIFSAKSYKTGLFSILLFLLIIYPWIEDVMTGDIGRLAEVNNEAIYNRNKLSQEYFSDYLFQSNNFILGNRTEWVRTHDGETPHNMFAETCLQGGIIGLILYILFLIKLFVDMIISFRRKRTTSISLVLSGVIISFIIISLMHSSGFHTGLSCAVFACALYLLSKELYK